MHIAAQTKNITLFIPSSPVAANTIPAIKKANPATNNKNAAVTVFQFSFIFGCLSQKRVSLLHPETSSSESNASEFVPMLSVFIRVSEYAPYELDEA